MPERPHLRTTRRLPPSAPANTSRRRLLLGTLGGALQLSGCGGGGIESIAGISTGGTGSFTVGPVAGFGSVIVGGIRFDDSSAEVALAGGSTAATPAALRLGMMVAIQGSTISGSVAAGTATATATRIVATSDWRGRVDAVNVAAGTFSMFGMTVRTGAATVFEGAGVSLLSGLSAGLHAEVYGFLDPATSTLHATRVEVFTSRPSSFLISGVASAPDATSFAIGSARIVAPTSPVPAAGAFVRATLSPVPDGAGRWTAVRLSTEASAAGPIRLEDDDEAELEGSITALSSAARFSVNGIPVDASGIAGVSSLGLAVGTIVSVEGRIRAGVVVTTELEVKSEQSLDEQEFEINGTVEQLDTVRKTFVVRGYAFRYDTATEFDLDGAVWRNGLVAKVEARLVDGRLYATEIELDD